MTVSLIGGGILLYLFAKFLFGAFLPFLLAFLLAMLTRPLARFFSRKTGWGVRLCAVLSTLIFLLIFSALFYLLVLRLFFELQRLLDFLVEDGGKEDGKIAGVIRFFREIGERLPLFSRLQSIDFIKDILGDPSQYFTAQLQKLVGELAGKLTQGVAALRCLPVCRECCFFWRLP